MLTMAKRIAYFLMTKRRAVNSPDNFEKAVFIESLTKLSAVRTGLKHAMQRHRKKIENLDFFHD